MFNEIDSDADVAVDPAFLYEKPRFTTYMYYAMAFVRTSYKKVFRVALIKNIPLVFIALWVLVAYILNYFIESESVKNDAGDILSISALIMIPVAMIFYMIGDINLHRKVMAELNYEHDDTNKKKQTFSEHLITYFLYIVYLALVWFISVIGYFFSGFLSMMLVFPAMFIMMIPGLLGFGIAFLLLIYFLGAMTTYSLSFTLTTGFAAAMTQDSSDSFSRIFRLGFVRYGLMFLMNMTDMLIKGVGAITVYLVVLAASSITVDFQSAEIVDALTMLFEKTESEIVFSMILVITGMAAFNLIWDIFKAAFNSLVLLHDKNIDRGLSLKYYYSKATQE